MAKKRAATKKAAKKKTTAKKSLARKSAAKKSVARKATAKKAGAKKSSARKSIKKAALSSYAARKSSLPTIAAKIDLRQSSEYMGQNWWKWSLWIDAAPSVLNDIEYVNYKLHSTFPDPVQQRTNAQEKFLLESSGWGEFTINAEIKPKNGKAFTKRHWLTLEYPQPTQSLRPGSTTATRKKHDYPTVFLSAGISDLRMGNALARALREQGIIVFKSDELSADVPWDFAITEMTKNADLMVVLLSGRPTGWTMREIYAARNQKKQIPIVPIVIGLDAIVPDELAESQAIKLKDADEPDEIAPKVAKQVLDRIKMLPPKS